MLNRVVSRLSRIHSRHGLYPFLEAELSRLTAGARVLSVGSGGGIGRVVGKMSKITGFDVSQIDIDAARNPDIVGDIHDYQCAEPFDAILLSEVLEHLYNPWKAVGNIRTLVKPGGRVIVTVPFLFPIHDEPFDYYRFTEYGLREIFKEGFRIERLEAANSSLEAIAVQLYRLHTERRLPTRLFGIFAVLMSPLIYAVIKLLFFVKGERITTRYHLVAIRES